MFTHCSKTELYLKNTGVKFKYRDDVLLNELTEDWNAANYGRPKGHQRISEAIQAYADQMKQGSAAPAVILWDCGANLEVLDGCQRLSATQETGVTKCCAFIVTCSQSKAMQIRLFANIRLTGLAPVDPDWVLSEAVRLFIIQGSDTVEDVAEASGQPVRRVSEMYDKIRVVDALKIAFERKGKVMPELKSGIVSQMASCASVKDFADAADEVVSFVEDLLKCRFRNGDAAHHVNQFFGIKRIGNKDRKTQFRSKLREFRRDPMVSAALAGNRKLSNVQNIDSKLKGLLTAIKIHKKASCLFDDIALIEAWDAMHFEIGRLLREQCTNEIRRKLDPFSATSKSAAR